MLLSRWLAVITGQENGNIDNSCIQLFKPIMITVFSAPSNNNSANICAGLNLDSTDALPSNYFAEFCISFSHNVILGLQEKVTKLGLGVD